MVSTYTSYRFYTQDLSKALKRTAAEPQVQREAEYYQAHIGTVKSVDDFLRNDRLFGYAMKAYGLEEMTYAKAFMRKVLESDLTNANSFANKLSDTRYREFAAAFAFKSDGTLTNTADIQADDQEGQTIDLYTRRNASAVTATKVETAYYQSHIDAVTSVDDLLGDKRLYTYALEAVGLDPDKVSRTAIRNVLVSNLSDPASVAVRYGGDFLELAQNFNFAPDGSVLSGYTVQSATQKANMVDLYGDRAGAGFTDLQTALRTAYYRNNIDGVTSVDALLKNKTLYDYVLTAYGIDPQEVPKATVRRALESDLSDQNSYVNRLGDEKLQKLAAAFNFAADGKVTTRRLVQSIESGAKTVVLYQDTIADDTVAQNAAKKETSYYKETIGEIVSLDQFTSDKRLVAYVLKAYGLDGERLSTAAVRRILTSDLADAKSFANRLGDGRYRDLAAAFNFDADGTVAREAAEQAQSRKAALATADKYVRQTMEAEAGDQNEGVRLALYFARKASSIDSAYEILGDKALRAVVQTALGISDTVAAADIDVQAAMIERRLDLADFKDDKKLDKFLARFCALYDAANADTSTSTASILFGGARSTTGLGQSLIGSFQNLKIGRW